MTERIVRSPWDGREADAWRSRPRPPSRRPSRGRPDLRDDGKLPTYRRAAILRAVADGSSERKRPSRGRSPRSREALKAARTEVDRAPGTFAAAAAAVETGTERTFLST